MLGNRSTLNVISLLNICVFCDSTLCTLYNHYLIKIEWSVECGVYGAPVTNYLNGISIGFKSFSVGLRVKSNEMSIRTNPILVIIMKHRILDYKYRCCWPDTPATNNQPINCHTNRLNFCWKVFFSVVFPLLLLLLIFQNCQNKF